MAEIGENPLGDPEMATAFIRAAAEAGADAVKFQTTTMDELYNPSDPDYQASEQVELPRDAYGQLVEVAEECGVAIFSTPFDEPSADFLDEVGMPWFKVGSGELTHHALLRHVARKGKPMVLSTGMAERPWIEAAVRVIREAGNDQLIVAHCVSMYPAPLEAANVRAIPALRESLGVLVGFSDHIMAPHASIAAVALGACYVEKHFTLSRTLPEGDNGMSIEPSELRELVEGIRAVEAALGVEARSVAKGEASMIGVARRSVYARRSIRRGESIDAAMLAVRRPLSAIPADQLDLVVGRTAKVEIAAEQPLQWEHLTR